MICAAWWFGTYFILPYPGNFTITTDFHILQRGGSTTNQFIQYVPGESWSMTPCWCCHMNSAQELQGLWDRARPPRSSPCAVSWWLHRPSPSTCQPQTWLWERIFLSWPWMRVRVNCWRMFCLTVSPLQNSPWKACFARDEQRWKPLVDDEFEGDTNLWICIYIYI